MDKAGVRETEGWGMVRRKEDEMKRLLRPLQSVTQALAPALSR